MGRMTSETKGEWNMRKGISLFLLFLLIITSLSGCNITTTTDLWDGAIAESFAGGNGTQKKPFIIDKASQLAFLASDVNSGNNYEGKYFKLNCDIDLNYIEWTPIGNGINSFSGVFDGDGHTIYHLKIVSGATFEAKISSVMYNQYTTGLFGSISNATIKNTNIDEVDINIQDQVDIRIVSVGVLVGKAYSNNTTEISNVKISNAVIKADFEKKTKLSQVNVGGVIGYAYNGEETESNLFHISQVQSDVQVFIENKAGGGNFIGGIAGTFFVTNHANIQDCASYITISLTDYYHINNYFGAFGLLSTRNTLDISNMFSKTTVNKIHDYFGIHLPAYTANVIAGITNPSPISPGGGYNFKNVFGFIEQIDPDTNTQVNSMTLHDLPSEELYTSTNCQGCEQLPQNHGFNKRIWNLDNPSAPKLK